MQPVVMSRGPVGGVRRWLVPAAVAVLVVPSVAAAAPLGSLGEPDRLVVRGVREIDAEQLRRPLVDDPDIVWLSRPHASRSIYVDAVVRKATLALHHAGFARAAVKGDVESSDGVERLVLTVEEGPRFAAGAIEVKGLPDDVAARLVRFLSEPQPPADAVPLPIEPTAGAAGDAARADDQRGDDAARIEWITAVGRLADRERPAWEPGKPAACDAPALHAVRVAVARFLRDEGHLAIAPVVERRATARAGRAGAGTKSDFDAAIRTTDAGTDRGEHPGTDPGTDPGVDPVADLVITVTSLPPKAVLRRLDVPSSCRTTDRDLAGYLGIELGRPVTDRDRLVWRERLRRSGRFLRHEIDFLVDPLDAGVVAARFDLEEYPAATPLAEPLSRAEATMLRCREWLEAAIRRGDDIVVDVAGTPAAASRATLSATQGLLVEVPAVGADAAEACGLVVGGTAASLLPPGGRGRFDLPLPARSRVDAYVTLALSRDAAAPADRPRYVRNLTFGFGLASSRRQEAAPFGVDVRIEPVACLSLVHEGTPGVRFDGDTMTIETPESTSRFDVETGRPLGVTVAGREVTVAARTGALEEGFDRLRTAAGPNVARPDALATSAVEFLLSDGVAAACARIGDAIGLGGDDRTRFETALARAVAVARRCVDEGGLAGSDEAIQDVIGVAAAAAGDPATAVVADGATATEPEATRRLPPLEIPAEDEPTGASAVHRAVVRRVAAVVWRFTEDWCGRDSWPATLVRAASCGLASDPALLDEMTQFMMADNHGPLAHAVASALAPVPAVAMSLARRGQERLSTIAFHTDCHPLLEAARSCGLDEACVSLLRGLDDASAAEIGTLLCGDPAVILPLVRAVQAHDRREDAVQSLQASLDVWWDAALRGIVAARFDAVATPRTAAAPGGRDEKPVTK